MKTTIEKEIADRLKIAGTMSSLTNKVEIAAQLCIDTLQEGGKLLIFGNDGGQMNKICGVNLVIPSKDTPRIQEMHIVLGHTICHLIDLEFKD